MAETSETSSDTESSCGWTIISNEGSDIETLGSEVTVECGAGLLERPRVEEAELQDVAAADAGCIKEKRASIDETLQDPTIEETLCASEAGDMAPETVHVSLLSSSDQSDIVTLGDLKEDDHLEEEEAAAASEEFYMGTSCSSQYAFTAGESGLMLSHWKLPQSLVTLGQHLRSQLTGSRSFPVFPAQQPVVTNSSSSEDEAGRSAGTVVRRRRLRKNTTSSMTEPEEEEALETGSNEEKAKEETQQEAQAEVRPAGALDAQSQGPGSRMLKYILVVVVAVTLLLLCGMMRIQERQKSVKNVVSELNVCKEGRVFSREDPEEHKLISLLTHEIEKIKHENQELNIKQAHIQAQRDNMEKLLKVKSEEKTNIMSQQQSLAAENQLLKSSLEREENSLLTLQEELRNLRSRIRDLEAMGAGADSLLSENQRLKDQLEEEKQQMRKFHSQKEELMAEAKTVRERLNKEREVTEELRRELSRVTGRESESSSETEELQLRLLELEKRLSFEQQRSDLWERLYVETKEERAKGDTQTKRKKPSDGMAGRVKQTFDAVKNSTKEFVHHHKEQIKKAKEAVKENLRKFSDSVKSTFRHFKDSASTFINKARGFYDKKNSKESWQHRSHRHHHRHPHKSDDSSQSSGNTRKPGGKVHEDRGQSSNKAGAKGCIGVFDCAYQESMSLFNKGIEPIRADEFYQLLRSYLQQEVEHFHHWKEVEVFVNNFFHNGVFIHDQMLFTDFVSGIGEYLLDMHEYHGLDEDVFGDLNDFIYRHFFGEAYIKNYSPSGPFERPNADSKDESRSKHQQRKQQRTRSRPHSERKWSRSGRNTDRHMADVKIELGPMPFDPKY
ncbi:cell cycle progression protein 1 isoform X2 [Betta splendens]|uniref:Cell cycle progression protein 1 isoform X2 n=1 Tax=Betta splendens TaxID=158456 RepID=A0A6P7M186_BETSP|nr:cell cycle progression protein 1 isoform X2 [Betta splendens]